jgi:hypothetical protein
MGESAMLRKFPVLVFILGLVFTVGAPPASFAKDQNQNQNQNKQFQKKNVVVINKNIPPKKNIVVNKNVVVKQNVVVKKNYVIGRKYNGHVWYGQNRHRWHGVWYAYGVGPCWINIDGFWFWNELECPAY